jgi:hypothetical protein
LVGTTGEQNRLVLPLVYHFDIVLLTLENSAQKHNQKSKANADSSAEDICGIATEAQRTNPTNILNRSEETKSGSAGIIEVCHVPVSYGTYQAAVLLTGLPWDHSLEAIEKTSVVPIDCGPEEQNWHYDVELSKTRVFPPGDGWYVKPGDMFVAVREAI